MESSRLWMSTLLVVLILHLAPPSRANYAVLSVTRDPASNEARKFCSVYNPDHTHLDTLTQPSQNDYVLAVGNTSSYDTYGCSPPPSDLVANKTLFVLRGNCTFNEKAFVAQEALAAMLVVVYDGETVSSPVLNDSIRIPVLMVDNVTGLLLLENISTAPLYLYGYLPPAVTFDPSAVVLLLIAVVTVFLGSFIANTPYEFMRYGLLLRKGESCDSVGQSGSGGGLDKVSVVGVVMSVVLMLVLVCGMLLLLYFFYYPMVYIVLGLYSLAAVAALYHLLSPFVALIPVVNDKCRLPHNKLPILQYRPGPLFPATILVSVAIVTWWVVERHASYAWVLHDILGFTFITLLYQKLNFLRPWMVALIMCVLFFYDIFMVFITPFFTKDGVSVMETAAIGPPGSTESLPLVFTVIKFIYPTQLDVVCSASRPYGLLGYGDVGIPGLLVTLGLKHDLQFRRGKCFKIYYATAGIAYTIGLMCTYVALTFMKTAQPALLYLVPTTLLSVVAVSLLRREFRLFFTGKQQVNTTAGHCQEDAGSHSNGAHSDGAHSDGAHSDGGQDTDSEKSPLVNAMT